MDVEYGGGGKLPRLEKKNQQNAYFDGRKGEKRKNACMRRNGSSRQRKGWWAVESRNFGACRLGHTQEPKGENLNARSKRRGA